MKGVFWIKAFHDLAMVVTINKETNISGERLHSSWEASGSASQPFQIMAQIGIDCFHRICLFLVSSHFIGCTIIKRVIHRKGITVILFGLWCPFQTGLQSFTSSGWNYIPTQNAMSGSINDCQDVDFVFFCFRKVYISSNSAVCGFAGTCAGGSLPL